LIEYMHHKRNHIEGHLSKALHNTAKAGISLKALALSPSVP